MLMKLNIVQRIKINHYNNKIIHVTRLWYITAIIVRLVNDLICVEIIVPTRDA